MTSRLHQRGVTLIELMISMLLGLLIIGGMVALFSFSSTTYRQDETIARLNDETRFAVAQIVADVEMAGFWTQVFTPNSIQVHPNLQTLGVQQDCGFSPPPRIWAYDVREAKDAINFFDGQGGATVNTVYPCIFDSEIQPGADAIGVKRVAGARTLASERQSRVIYFRTNGSIGMLYRFPTPATELPTGGAGIPLSDWQYVPTVYFVRNYAIDPDDKIPSLCRQVLLGGQPPTFEAQCIAQGIETLQVEWGIDPGNDGVPDFYTAQPTAVQLNQATTVKLFVLGRAASTDRSYANKKTYVLSNFDAAYAPNDAFYRRVVTTVVRLRNPTALRRMAG